MKILVTGANGFVGRALFLHLLRLGHDCIGVAREAKNITAGVSTVAMGDIAGAVDWGEVLKGVDCIIHLAGRAHKLKDKADNPELEFERTNYDATMALVRQAVAVGVKRFIYLSSIGVHGQESGVHAFSEKTPFAASSPYTKSKLKAEKQIREYLCDQSMEWVVIRPPLVYSGQAPGNFKLLLELVSRRLPLPFSGVVNQRSMIALENLVDFLVFCMEHPRAAREEFVISDGDQFAIGEIASLLAIGMGVKTLQFYVPTKLLRLGATLIGRRNTYTQLFGSLTVDSSKACSLGWQPVISGRTALIKAGHDFIFHAS
ncbi:MAG: NAD-dependent epimerase/dehydratase family protein [Pseudomonas sp.]|uniref:NAD-dependent epimerase/dehydratase family protein n=1 Tax=Pseudomonas TaxID=286 RepID=UPI0003C0823E|nr:MULTISPECIES: NAD-dependent epimerase/dehydratase family protein [unclassified Pseudomonas]AGZ34131.1 UDP-glucose 4-epimerase [Pseudomonas sp. VLB120]WEZ89957.1 NAD-dependent epimerase/dehydratase family protein [Pseudomonas sp. NyZ480]